MAREPRFDLHRLDVSAFTREGSALDGEFAVASLPRLREVQWPGAAAGEAAAAVAWRAQGEQAALGPAGKQAALHVTCDTTLSLQCQRCLQAVAVPVHVDRRLFFVEGEDAAAVLDTESDDDVLAMPRVLDLTSLLEDELLLALPIVPRHEVCPDPLPAVSAAAFDEPAPAPEEHPFAALAALKRSARPH